MTDEATERRRAAAAGQEHVFRFWNELADEGHARLLRQLATVDYDLVTELGALIGPASDGGDHALEPPELFPLQRDAAAEARTAEARRAGAELLAAGKIGYVLVAGGQASRLGYDGPKGTFPVGPVSSHSLFRWHAHRLLAAQRRHGAPTPWYVMTSPINDAATREFFADQGFFGLPRNDVSFFQQDMLPALDTEGRILLADRGRLFLAPNGHGGTLLALARSGALADMHARGVEHISYFQVDNPLARPADPLFLGLHALERAGMSSKVVKKRDANEKVGVLGRIDGRMGCIEYSDLPADLREERDPDGELTFRAGNIAVHVLDVGFVEDLTRDGFELPWHLARKAMPVVGDTGALVEREGVKFETFVFDALARSERCVTLEVDRALEFSPIKNAVGVDSPATCRADLCRLFASWVEVAGLELPPAGSDGLHPIEIDPLVAESAEELRARNDVEPHVGDQGHHYA
ncbi:MAG: UDPGP type 1 family protein [Planctomycetota bacterium]|nr:UDPGP type 1 family protein [Planctomycetota bacterium]